MLFRIHEGDNVAVALAPRGDIPPGHKIALRAIAAGEDVIKYGFPIGHATAPILAGEWVHTHNLATNLHGVQAYTYEPQLRAAAQIPAPQTFCGYRRPDGRVGVRNEIWVVPTVGCVNRTAELIVQAVRQEIAAAEGIDGVFEFKHPYGCSQMGADQVATQKILADLVTHPNAAGVLVVSLGCENNHIGVFSAFLSGVNEQRVKVLVAQDAGDEVAEGVRLVRQLVEYARHFRREPCPVAALTVGLKCGGSDGFSGITANPLVGAFSDMLIDQGGTSVLTEVPEMFGAETLLMNRCVSPEVFMKTVRLINSFKEYYLAHNQPVYDNPSPGNKQGGISTLEEKSLGCTQKGGQGNVVDVVDYGDRVTTNGLNLLSAPGNDMVAATALAAAGCQIVLFTTGRGTPLGTCVPTIKIATNTDLFSRKSHWMDFDAGRLLAGIPMAALAGELWDQVLAVASGQVTRSESMGNREIAIFKNGVTL